MKNITIITSTRAEYGLLRPVIQKVAAAQDLQLQLVVTGAHLCARFGNTVQEIEADSLPIAARLPIFEEENPNEPVALPLHAPSRYLTAILPPTARMRCFWATVLKFLRWLQRLRHGISPLRIFPAGM